MDFEPHEILEVVPRAGDDPNGHANPQAAAAGAGAGAGAGHPAAGQEDPVAVAAAQRAKEDAEYLDKMRGWLMTVATLFVGFAFQAAMHPPPWIPQDYLRLLIAAHGGAASDAKTKLANDEGLLAARDGGLTVPCFMALNMLTFATGLVLLVTLLVMKRGPSGSDMNRITFLVKGLAATVACTFAAGVSADPVAALLVLVFLTLYAILAFVRVMGWIRGVMYQRVWQLLQRRIGS
ncbi:hypothetical protein CFC21_090438 [Triticum aestivum]|uniref:PGG domain-containing protein n=2 Tax=Triticum aestivum TaxID=4565 RepID=A0A9R1LEB5_WHEAT|nr:hypothetical protein CFC21_090432 [Triticum aestivum]KAF7087239.1 hypothetical protein CFC21_090438 [Triticum aestivum]